MYHMWKWGLDSLIINPLSAAAEELLDAGPPKGENRTYYLILFFTCNIVDNQNQSCSDTKCVYNYPIKNNYHGYFPPNNDFTLYLQEKIHSLLYWVETLFWGG